MNFRDVFNTALEECINFDALVIDPYNSLAVCEDIKGNSHERDYQIASEFRMFCKKNNKTIYLLAHGNTDALRKQYPKGHSFEGHPIPLMAADIEGGGKWVNRADDFIVIHRLTQHETEWMNTEVHVKKVKETETGGNTTFMDSPIIFKLQKDQLSFICYTRSEPGYVPEVVKNPLSDKPQPQQKEIELKPNEEFEQEVEEVKPIQIPKQQKEDWVDDIFTEEKWTL